MEGCLVWIAIFVIIMMLVSYGLAGTLTIILVLGIAVLLVLGVASYFTSKHAEEKKRVALSIQHEEEKLRDHKLRQTRLNEEKQLLSLLEQYGGANAISAAQTSLQSESLSWDQVGTQRNRTNVLESYLLQTFAYKVNEAHIETLLRKRRQGVYSDDYGRTISNKWNNDLTYYIKNVFLDELYGECEKIDGYPIKESIVFQNRVLAENDENIVYWADYINHDLDRYTDDPENDYDPTISGHDYEQFVADLIEIAGWAVLVTKGSGDHGADIIATIENQRIAVQCKKYNNPVGNKSVQEVFSAASFYDCAFGCVVSNTDFTTAARQAAAKLDVPLLHHEDVTDYFTTLRNQFEANEPDYDNT